MLTKTENSNIAFLLKPQSERRITPWQGIYLMVLTSSVVILLMISEIAVLSKVPIALQYIFTGKTSCHTTPSLFSWCSTYQKNTATDVKETVPSFPDLYFPSGMGIGEQRRKGLRVFCKDDAM